MIDCAQKRTLQQQQINLTKVNNMKFNFHSKTVEGLVILPFIKSADNYIFFLLTYEIDLWGKIVCNYVHDVVFLIHSCHHNLLVGSSEYLKCKNPNLYFKDVHYIVFKLYCEL